MHAQLTRSEERSSRAWIRWDERWRRSEREHQQRCGSRLQRRLLPRRHLSACERIAPPVESAERSQKRCAMTEPRWGLQARTTAESS